MEQNVENSLFDFKIEDNVPYSASKVRTKPVDKFVETVYNTANKLNVNQSFFMPKGSYPNLKYPLNKVHNILNKLVKYHKKGDLIIEFKKKFIKDENGNELGIRIWRTA